MIKHRVSTGISLGVCIFSSLLLLVWLFTFPQFIQWLYYSYAGFAQDDAGLRTTTKTVITCFYICAPFAAAALGMLIALLVNLLKNRVFVAVNVTYLRLVSWCCYAVLLITFIPGVHYLPLMIVAFAMGVVGTLLRVVKNVMHTAVALQEENDLTI